VELIELIEPLDQGWDTVAPARIGSVGDSTGEPGRGRGRGRGWLVAAGLAAAFGLGLAVQRGPSGGAGDVSPAPSTTTLPSTIAPPVPSMDPEVLFPSPPVVVTSSVSPLLVDVPGMLAVSTNTGRSPQDDEPPVVVFHNPVTGETLRLGDVPTTVPPAITRIDLGDGMVGHEWRTGDVTTLMLEGSDPVRAVIGTASIDTLRRVLVVGAQGGMTEDVLTELGFSVRLSLEGDGLWSSADETTTNYVPINDPRATPLFDRPSITLNQLPLQFVSEAWELVLPQRFDVRGTTAYGGHLDSQAVLGVPLADQVVVLHGTGFSLEQLVAAAPTLRPAGGDEWAEIQSGQLAVGDVIGQVTLSPIDSGVLFGGAPWRSEVQGNRQAIESWGGQAGSARFFGYLSINRVDRPLLDSTVVLGATAVLAVAPRDGVYQLRVTFADGVRLDLPLRAVGDESEWQARSYMWSELGAWSAVIIDGTGTVVATLDPAQ
jgi:hypothetical protein